MSEWISVDERMPDKRGRYIVFANDIIDCFVDTVNLYICPEYGNCFWENINGDDYTPVVTHWMPLPEPPKKEG